MDSKELRLFREAYGSIFEGYGKKKKEKECVDKEESEKEESEMEETLKHEGDTISEMDERSPQVNAAKQEAAKLAAQKRREAQSSSSSIGREGAADRRSAQLGREAMRRAGIGNPKPSGAIENVDIFDIVKGHLMSEGATEEEALKMMVTMTKEERNAIAEQYTINVADVKGGTEAAKRAQSGATDVKTGKPLYKPGPGVGPDFKLLKGV